MRRPVRYLAGLLLVTGASLAFAGPASAAVAHGGSDEYYSDEYYSDSFNDEYYLSSTDVSNFSQIGLVNLGGLGLFGTGVSN